MLYIYTHTNHPNDSQNEIYSWELRISTLRIMRKNSYSFGVMQQIFRLLCFAVVDGLLALCCGLWIGMRWDCGKEKSDDEDEGFGYCLLHFFLFLFFLCFCLVLLSSAISSWRFHRPVGSVSSQMTWAPPEADTCIVSASTDQRVPLFLFTVDLSPRYSFFPFDIFMVSRHGYKLVRITGCITHISYSKIKFWNLLRKKFEEFTNSQVCSSNNSTLCIYDIRIVDTHTNMYMYCNFVCFLFSLGINKE